MRKTAALAALVLGGCVSFGKTEPARFYLMSTLAPDAGADFAAEPVVGVRPISVPDYLRRPEIVTRPAEHEVRVAAFDRWAAPLDEEIARVLVENLAVLTGARVVTFPWHPATPVGAEVEVSIGRFESTAAGSVLLVSRWTVLDAEGTVRTSRASTVTEPCDDPGGDAGIVVAAMSEALGALSREIAVAIAPTP